MSTADVAVPVDLLTDRVLPPSAKLIWMVLQLASASQPWPGSDYQLREADLVALGNVIWKPFPLVYLVRTERYNLACGPTAA